MHYASSVAKSIQYKMECRPTRLMKDIAEKVPEFQDLLYSCITSTLKSTNVRLMSSLCLTWSSSLNSLRNKGCSSSFPPHSCFLKRSCLLTTHSIWLVLDQSFQKEFNFPLDLILHCQQVVCTKGAGTFVFILSI